MDLRAYAYGGEQYPGFFTLHSLGFMGKEKSDGSGDMQKTWHHILSGLCDVLRQDEKSDLTLYGSVTPENSPTCCFP